MDMSRQDVLLELADLCYSQARITLSPETKHAFEEMGDRYRHEADALKSNHENSSLVEEHELRRRHTGHCVYRKPHPH